MSLTILNKIFKYLKNIKLWLFLFWSLLTIWTQIAWFAGFAVFLMLSLIIEKRPWYKRISNTIIYQIYAPIKWFVLIIILSVIIRTFFIEIYNIPSGSMEKTLIPGDIVIVDKITLGMDRPKSFL